MSNARVRTLMRTLRPSTPTITLLRGRSDAPFATLSPMFDDAVGEVVEGLWQFVAVHPDSDTPEWAAAAEGGEDGWDPRVSWWVVAVSGGLVLIDPLVEDWHALDLLMSARGDCQGLVRTCHWHQRSAAEAASRYVASALERPDRTRASTRSRVTRSARPWRWSRVT